jgi:hypothetical protein
MAKGMMFCSQRTIRAGGVAEEFQISMTLNEIHVEAASQLTVSMGRIVGFPEAVDMVRLSCVQLA